MLKNIFVNFQDLEPACKEYFLKSDTDLSVLVLIATALLIPPMNYLDYINYHWSWDYLLASAFEVFLVVFSILVILIIRRFQQVGIYENLVFAWSFFATAAACYIVLI